MNKKGFSLIEVLISLMILGILFTIGFIAFTPEKLKYDQYVSSFVNVLYRAKMAAIFNLYNANLIYNANTGVFSVFIDENKNNVRDNNENIIHQFPSNIDFLRRGKTKLSQVRVFNGINQENLNLANETNIVIFNRLGFATTTIPNTQTIEIIFTNQEVNNKYRYLYVVRVTSGGDIRMIKINL